MLLHINQCRYELLITNKATNKTITVYQSKIIDCDSDEVTHIEREARDRFKETLGERRLRFYGEVCQNLKDYDEVALYRVVGTQDGDSLLYPSKFPSIRGFVKRKGDV